MNVVSIASDFRTWPGNLLVGLICAAFIGCGSPKATVTGSVRLDGKPLETGIVVFHATDGNYRETKGAEVIGGRYDISGLPIKAMDVETTRSNDVAPLGARIRVQLKPGSQVIDLDLVPNPKKTVPEKNGA